MDAKIILFSSDIRTLPLSWYGGSDENGERQIAKKLKEITGNRWDNSRLMFSNVYGYLFVLYVHRERFMQGSSCAERTKPLGAMQYDEKGEVTNVFSWNLWDVSGNAALGSGMFMADKESPMPKEILRKIEKLSEMYVRGEIHCSDCQKVIKRSEVAGHYFAGNYCQECWDREWRAREARETYE